MGLNGFIQLPSSFICILASTPIETPDTTTRINELMGLYAAGSSISPVSSTK